MTDNRTWGEKIHAAIEAGFKERARQPDTSERSIPRPVAAAPGRELAAAQATIEDLRRELDKLRGLREIDSERARVAARADAVAQGRIATLRQALMDIMTGNVVAPGPVPEPILKLAHEALRADDAKAKPPAQPKEEP